MLVLEGAECARTLRIPSWLEWNSVDRSTDRVKEHRKRQRNADVTRSTDVPPRSETVVERTETPSEERRVEEKRGDPPNPPDGGSGPAPPDSESTRIPDDPIAAELLEELKLHSSLADVATAKMAESQVMAKGTPVSEVKEAIGEAASAIGAEQALAPGPLNPIAIAKTVAKYVRNARPSRDGARSSEPDPPTHGLRVISGAVPNPPAWKLKKGGAS